MMKTLMINTVVVEEIVNEACNKNLSDFESTRKNEVTGEYEDLCNECYSAIQNNITESEEDTPTVEYTDDEY